MWKNPWFLIGVIIALVLSFAFRMSWILAAFIGVVLTGIIYGVYYSFFGKKKNTHPKA